MRVSIRASILPLSFLSLAAEMSREDARPSAASRRAYKKRRAAVRLVFLSLRPRGILYARIMVGGVEGYLAGLIGPRIKTSNQLKTSITRF